MEIFTIDGIVAMQCRKNKAMLAYLGPGETMLARHNMKHYSVFRLRRKTMMNVVYLNIRKRKRMLELLSGVGLLMFY